MEGKIYEDIKSTIINLSLNNASTKYTNLIDTFRERAVKKYKNKKKIIKNKIPQIDVSNSLTIIFNNKQEMLKQELR